MCVPMFGLVYVPAFVHVAVALTVPFVVLVAMITYVTVAGVLTVIVAVGVAVNHTTPTLPGRQEHVPRPRYCDGMFGCNMDKM